MRLLLNWLDDRTGYRRVVDDALYENIPGGSRWRFVTGSMLVFAFCSQIITGIFLWMFYSPGSQNAWESVYYIQNEMQGGWLLRGLHHYMAHAMVVLLPIHMFQVIWDKAYRPPREFNYWTGLLMMVVVMALSLTGYLLPWDQKGYWATKVATNLVSLGPGGEYVQLVVVGGRDYGHQTLTRFFALHAGVLPLTLLLLLGLHLAFFRRHGITAETSPQRPDQYFWPHQVLKDGLACLILLVAVLLTIIHWDVVGLVTAKLGEPTELGAHLTAPADAAEEYRAARPEWYFLFLFQMLKKFKSEFVGMVVFPAILFSVFFLMPLWGRWKLGHAFNVLFMLALAGGVFYLTGEAVYEDYYAQFDTYDPEKYEEGSQEQARYEDRHHGSKAYLEAVEQGKQEYERIKELIAFYGIPRVGALNLQQQDPETQGPRLFRRHCASCHSYLDENGEGIEGPRSLPDGEPNGGPNLYGFASRKWLEGFLDHERIVTADYFGNTRHGQVDEDGAYRSGGMVEYVHDTLVDLSQEDQQALKNVIAAISYEARLPAQRADDAIAEQDGTLDDGRDALVNNFGCTDCHKFGEEGDLETAPDLSGYGSAEWLRQIIANPEHVRFYGYLVEDEEGNERPSNDRMPAFAPDPEDPTTRLLTEHELDMLVRWLRGDDKHLEDKLNVAPAQAATEQDAP